MAGELVQRRPPSEGADAGLRRRRVGPGDRGVDRLPGGLDDGAWLRGSVRPRGQRLVHLDPDVRALRGPVRAQTAVASAPRSARPARVLDLAGLVQPRPGRPLGAARLSLPALPARADAAPGGRKGPPPRAGAAARPDVVADRRARVPDWLSRRAQRGQLERHRRRLRRCDRGRSVASRPADVRPLAARQRERRYVRPGGLLRLRPLPGHLRVERDLGRPARGPRGGDRLRSAHPAGPVHARSPDPRPVARRRRWPTRGRPTRSRCGR